MSSILRCAISLAAVLGALGGQVSAQIAATVTLDLPQQSLAESLRAVGKQTETNILIDLAMVRGIQAPALNAQLTVDEAISRLLAGTGIRYRFIDQRTVVLSTEDGIGTVKSPVSEGEAVAQMTQAQSSWASGAEGKMRLTQAAGSYAEDAGRAIQEPQDSQGSEKSSSSESSEGLQEIVVTAERRAERVQDLPIAISVYSGDTLDERRILNVDALSKLNASVRVPRSDSNDVRVTMRGVGTFAGFEPAVALVLDGVPYSSTRMGNNFNLFDVERVEVLRGPQGTLGGRNATAGGIYVTSKRPTETVEGYLRGTLGNYSRLALQGAVGGPIIEDRLLARVAMQADRADGWIQNVIVPADERENIDVAQARLGLEARFTDNFIGLLTMEGYKSATSYGSLQCGRARPDQPSFAELNNLPDCPTDPIVRVDRVDKRDVEIFQGALRFEWDLAGSTQLTSVTAYYDIDVRWDADFDGTPARLGFLTVPYHQPQLQKSQELTLTGDITDRLDYVAGALYVRNEWGGSLGLVFLPSIPEENPLLQGGHEKLTSWSGYGQLRYRLTDQLRLTAGVRYNSDEKEFYSYRAGFINDEASNRGSWGEWTPRFSLDWQPHENLTLYTTAARGYKAGGFSRTVGPELGRTVDPEYVWSYEAGIKVQGWDNRLQADLTVFSMDYENLQQDIISTGGQGIQIGTVNAGKGTIRGIEFNFQGRPIPALHLSSSVTYLGTAEYDDLRSHDRLYPELGTLDPVLGLNIRDLSGNRLVGAPKWQYNVSGDYTQRLNRALEAVLSASYNYNGESYSTIFNNPGIEGDSAGVVDLTLGVGTVDGRWRVSAFVQNLTDERYTLHAFGSPPSYWRSGLPGQPRRYGLELEHRF